MKSLTRVIVVSAVVFIAAPAAMRAHFKLVEPASWLILEPADPPADVLPRPDQEPRLARALARALGYEDFPALEAAHGELRFGHAWAPA